MLNISISCSLSWCILFFPLWNTSEDLLEQPFCSAFPGAFFNHVIYMRPSAQLCDIVAQIFQHNFIEILCHRGSFNGIEGGITHIFYCIEHLAQIHKIDSHSFKVSHSSTKSLSLCWAIVLTCQSVFEKQYDCLWIMCLASLCWLNRCSVCRQFCRSLFSLTFSPGCNELRPISICSAC